MSLASYKKKRNFKRTPEPVCKKNPSISKRLYVIHQHAASHLHYDLRLEIDGVLKSWAVPKGPSLDPSIKRLAIHVEDHPVEYGAFEGVIPQGQYGAGNVLLWDDGEWQCLDVDVNKAYKNGNLSFILEGKKLKGLWKLIRIKKNPKNWLFFKVEDSYARPEKNYSIVDKKPLSVISRRSIDNIKARG